MYVHKRRMYMCERRICAWKENVGVCESENICMCKEYVCMRDSENISMWKENVGVCVSENICERRMYVCESEKICMCKETVCVRESENVCTCKENLCVRESENKTSQLWVKQQCRSSTPPSTSRRGRHISALISDSGPGGNKCALWGGKLVDHNRTPICRPLSKTADLAAKRTGKLAAWCSV